MSMPVIFSLALLFVDSGLFTELLTFAVYYGMVMVPAAILLARRLLATIQLSPLEQAILGYPAAVAVYCLMFYILDLLGLRWLGYVFAIVPLSLLWVDRYDGVENKIENSISILLVVFYSFVFALFFLAFSLTTALPTNETIGLYYQDSLWTVGNTWSIIREGFPVSDARFDGAPFSYHMAQNIYYAFVHQLTGIYPFDLHLRIAPIYDLFFLVGALVVGGKVFLGQRGWEAAIIPLAVLFTAGSLQWGVTGYLGHIYINPLSMFFGLSAYIYLLMLLGYHAQRNQVFIVYSGLVALVAFSSKASIPLVMLPAMATYLAYQWLQGYQLKARDLTLGVVLVGVILLLESSIYAEAAGGFQLRNLTPLNDLQVDRVAEIVGESLASMAVPFGPLIKPAFIFFRGFLHISLTFYFLTIAGLWLISKDFRQACKAHLPFMLFLFTFTVISSLWVAFFSFPGGRVYFVWYAVLAWAVFFGMTFMQFLFRPSRSWQPVVAVVLLSVGLVMFSTYALNFFNSPWWRIAVLNDIAWDARATISAGEWEAMVWVKNNLPEDVILISDRRGFKHERSGEFRGRFFGYSALSGRQLFNEGDDFNRKSVAIYAEDRWHLVDGLMSAGSADEADTFWAQIPADYLVVSKRFSTPGAGLLKISTPVFENADVSILRKNAPAVPSG